MCHLQTSLPHSFAPPQISLLCLEGRQQRASGPGGPDSRDQDYANGLACGWEVWSISGALWEEGRGAAGSLGARGRRAPAEHVLAGAGQARFSASCPLFVRWDKKITGLRIPYLPLCPHLPTSLPPCCCSSHPQHFRPDFIYPSGIRREACHPEVTKISGLGQARQPAQDLPGDRWENQDLNPRLLYSSSFKYRRLPFLYTSFVQHLPCADGGPHWGYTETGQTFK